MIGELLKEERLKNNLTQKQLAEKSGISYVSINRIENGTSPRLSVLVKIFGAMDKALSFELKDKVTAPLDLVSN